MFLSDVKILTALYRWGWCAHCRNQVRGGGGRGGVYEQIAFEVQTQAKFAIASWTCTRSDVKMFGSSNPSGWWHPRYKNTRGERPGA